jgi:predicted ArsR family transcriptional regulator
MTAVSLDPRAYRQREVYEIIASTNDPVSIPTILERITNPPKHDVSVRWILQKLEDKGLIERVANEAKRGVGRPLQVWRPKQCESNDSSPPSS